MSPRLRNLLVLVAVFGAGLVVYLPLPNATRADLKDAGILQACSPIVASCSMRLPSGRYGTRTLLIAKCANLDGGKAELIVPSLPPGFSIPDVNVACTRASATCDNPALCDAGTPDEVDGGAYLLLDTDDCACRRTDAGLCRTHLLDGGLVLAPIGVTLTDFQGTGCFPKPCGPEWNGEQGGSWPPECPGG